MRALLVPLALALLLGSHGEVWADRTEAEYFAQRGDKALKARDWAGAQVQYRKALEADASFLLARAGVAEALLGAGDRDSGLTELRKFVADVEAGQGLPPPWLALAAKARKRLADVDAAAAQLEAIADRRVSDLLAFSDRWAEKDPVMAIRALREVLRLRATEARALDALEKLGVERPFTGVHVFNGRDWAGWMQPVGPQWAITGGSIVADVPTGLAVAVRAKETWSGQFDMVMEARLEDDRTADHPALFLLHAAVKSDYDHMTFGILGEEVVLIEERSSTSSEQVFHADPASLPKPFDPKAWNRYELRFRADVIEAVVNGEVLFSQPRPAERDAGGVGMRVQSAKVSIRAIDVVPR